MLCKLPLSIADGAILGDESNAEEIHLHCSSHPEWLQGREVALKCPAKLNGVPLSPLLLPMAPSKSMTMVPNKYAPASPSGPIC